MRMGFNNYFRLIRLNVIPSKMVKLNLEVGRLFSQPVLRRDLPFSLNKLISVFNEENGLSPIVKRKTDLLPIPVMKRQKRASKPTAEQFKPGHCTVTAYATAEQYDLLQLAGALVRQDLYRPSELTNDEVLESGLSSALHAIAKYNVTKEKRHIYYFQEGTVVMWNCSEVEQHSIVNFIHPHEMNQYDNDVIFSEIEEMHYVYEPTMDKTYIDDGVMHIGTKGRTVEEIASARYTLSNAMALSVKLGILETLLTRYIQTIEPVTQELRNGLPVTITQSGILRKSGELFALRHSLSLSTDFLDIPDFYWDRENLEGLYHSSCSYFSITGRTKVLSEKLNHCHELITLVSTHLSDRHHVRLEWMIIVLIMVEVGFEILHFLKG